MLVRLLVLVSLLGGVTAPLHAQILVPSAHGDPAVWTLPAVFAQADPDRTEWQRRLEAAQDRRHAAKRLVLYGLGISGAGVVLAIAGSGDALDPNTGLVTLGAVASLAGGGVCIFGGYGWLSANGDIDDLDREGRMNGYLTLRPMRGGMQLAAVLRF